MADSKKKSKKGKKGVEAFDDEKLDDEELEDDEDENEEEEDESEDEDESDDEEEGEDEEDDDDDEEGEIDAGFAPFVVSDDSEWELSDVLNSAGDGEAVYLYLPPDADEKRGARWYALKPVNIGEVEVTPSE